MLKDKWMAIEICEVPTSQRILELNPSHPAVQAMQQLFARQATDERLEKYCRLLYDQALVTEGSRVKDPVQFAQALNELLARDAAS